MILLIDNYDSFSYNLYQLIGSLNEDILVKRNDKISLEEIDALAPEAIILSPGPGRPQDAGICIDTVKTFYNKIPILGVCLGHQSICEAFGGTVTYATELMHGKQSMATLADSRLFNDCDAKEPVARYHSLALDPATTPDCLEVIATAEDKDGTKEVMAVCHKDYPVYGVQFHPESIMTPHGNIMMKNFLEQAGAITK